ncbi:MAG: fatty acid desaturase [Planctomycetaceae bacterium]|nr:fatty acid desaturase [Planctomycetaceae bacterium]
MLGSAAYREIKNSVDERVVSLRNRRPGGILSHPADIHCVVYQLLNAAAYGICFYVYLHPEIGHIRTPLEMGAFVVGAALLLGWISGVNVGVNFHNHVHLRIFKASWLNTWFGRLWAITGGWPSYWWKYGHVTVHHADTLGPDDWTVPKFDAQGKFEGYWKYCLLHWPWRYGYEFWQEFFIRPRGRRFRREALWEFLIFGALYSIPFIIDPMMGLLLWVLPHFVANVLIMASGMYVQHVDCDRASDAHPFRHSNTFFSPFFNLTMFNIGYHNVHHSFAHVHWSDLPEFQPLLQQSFDRDNACAISIGYFRASVECAHGQTWDRVKSRFPVLELVGVDAGEGDNILDGFDDRSSGGNVQPETPEAASDSSTSEPRVASC